MVFDCIFTIDQEPNKVKKKQMLKALTDDEFEVIKHCYFNKDVKQLKKFAKDFLLYHYNMPTAPKPFIEIIRYAATDFRDGELLTMIFDYVNAVTLSQGNRAGRRASRVLFGEQRCIGITIADVENEIKRRASNNDK